MQEKDVTILQWLWDNDYDKDVHKRFDKYGVEQGIISDFAKKKDQLDEEVKAKLSEALELSPECFCNSVMVKDSNNAAEYDYLCADIKNAEERLDCYRYFKAIPAKYVGDFVSRDREEYQKTHKKSPVCDRGFFVCFLILFSVTLSVQAGLSGIFLEHKVRASAPCEIAQPRRIFCTVLQSRRHSQLRIPTGRRREQVCVRRSGSPPSRSDYRSGTVRGKQAHMFRHARAEYARARASY